MRKALVTAATIALVTFGGGAAVADSTPDCPEIGHQVDTSAGDPYSLDRDGNGVGCQSYTGPPQTLPELGFDAAPATTAPAGTPELAETGWGPGEHPIRWAGAVSALLVGGAASMVISNKRKAVRI